MEWIWLKQRLIKALIFKIIPFDIEQAVLTGDLAETTKEKGLSLGDRACLALAMFHNHSIVTANKAWAEIRLGVEVVSIT